MIISFCGHRDFQGNSNHRRIMLDILEKRVGDKPAEFLLGVYGNFDSFAYECCKIYKQRHIRVSIIAHVPYLNHKLVADLNGKFDAVVYPEIENQPKKFAITYCNRYMVEKSDFVIAYVSRKWGGAYATYKFAKRQGKEILNLSQSAF